MGFLQRLAREVRFHAGLVRTLARVASISSKSANLVCDDLERAVDRWRTRPALVFDSAVLTYGELDDTANRYAHWGEGLGLARGAAIAVLLPNRLDYPAIWLGLSKVGLVAALVNDELVGASLAHCLAISGARHSIVDDETADRLAAVRPTLAAPMEVWTLGVGRDDAADLAAAVAGQSAARPRKSRRAGLAARDTALMIYTSGTTGLPKAVRINHMRAQLYMRGFAGATGARASDRIHIALPLSHATGGLCALGAALLNGGAAILRRRFSASHFWSEVVAARATMFVYVGEICAYLVAQAPAAGEGEHRLRLAFGNGMRSGVWSALENRFKVPRVLEFYGSTEGNVSLFNFDGTLGALGRVPPWLAPFFNVALVRYDFAAEGPVRGADGRCVQAAAGDVGECVGKIGDGARTAWAGYADTAASEKKVLRDVFSAGDAWFATGDLMRQDARGYLYFVDRVGDTFRWKGENVSTIEVAQALMAIPRVTEAAVFGIPVGDQPGKAGIAAMVVAPNFDLRAFADAVDAALPAYARPLFLRLTPRLEVTGTFKPKKSDLVARGFDPARVDEPLYFRDGARGFVRLTPEVYARITAPGARL